MAELVLVPTPIGNLEDITLRAIRILKECDVIYAEDTRVTMRLLKHLDISKQLIAFHAHNEHRALEGIVQRIETNKLSVLVSDAGTPGISDPGFLLTRACIDKGIKVSCLPGPTAFVPALVGSGMACDRFVYEGFLPHKKGRQTKWLNLQEEERTIVLYESPHRLVKCLGEIVEYLGENRKVCVVREVSKMFETFHRGTASELLTYFNETAPRGEIVVVIEGKNKKDEKRSNRAEKKAQREQGI